MTPEQLKLVQDTAEKLYKKDTTTHPYDDPYREEHMKAQLHYNFQQERKQEIFKAGAIFYEISVFPEILEAEIRKAFNAAREKCYAERNPLNYPSELKYPNPDDYINRYVLNPQKQK